MEYYHCLMRRTVLESQYRVSSQSVGETLLESQYGVSSLSDEENFT